MKETWTAEHLSTGWAIVYDRTPNGKKNDDGSMSYSMRLPVLLMSDWLADPEQTAKDIAREMNAFHDLLEAIKALEQAADSMGDATNCGMCDEALSKARAAIAKAEATP